MFEREHTASPEQALWQSVLIQAVEDAILGVPAAGGGGDRKNRIRLTEEARQFLMRPSKDLSLVCAAAGLDMQAVIERLRQKIAQAPTPEELLSTPRTARHVLSKRAPKEPKQQRGPVTYTIDGETLTVAEWSERTGVKVQTIKQRIAKGWDIRDAITLTKAKAKRRAHETFGNRMKALAPARKRGSPERLLTHNGQTHTYKEWAQITGLKVQTIKNRLGKGLTVAQALTPANLRGKSLADLFPEERQAA